MTEEQPAEKSKSIITLVISLIAVVAIFAVLLNLNSEGGNKVKYNGFEFVDVNGLWRTEWQFEGQPYELYFRSNPKQVENIPVEGGADARFQSREVYITVDPSDERAPETAYVTLAAVELAGKLTDPFEREVVAACTRNETESCSERPIITCDNTNSSVIYLKQAEEAKIVLNGNCAIIQGKGEGIVMAADKALFEWLSIMS